MKHKLILLILVSSSLTSCANNPLRSYSSETNQPLQDVTNHQLQKAIDAFGGDDSDVMNRLELASLYRMDMQYPKSIDNLISANAYVDLWYQSYNNTQAGNVGNVLEAGLLNDKVLNYQVKDYEKVMIFTYQALNHLDAGDTNSARVEITRMYQMEDKIKNFRDAQYAKAKASASNNPQGAPSLDQFESANKNSYDFSFINQTSALKLENSYQNAFSHYLAGFVFEKLGEKDLAYPAYRRALELNPGNTMIQANLNIINNHKVLAPGTTDLLIVEEVGHAPQVVSKSLSVPWVINRNNNNCPIVLKMSIPSLRVDQTDKVVPIKLDDRSNLNPVFFTDINLMAARTIHDNLPNIFIENLIRVGRDFLAQQEACQQGGGIGSLAAAGFGQIFNEADERTWVMLPSKFYVTRTTLKQGIHQITVQLPNGATSSVKVKLSQAHQVLVIRVIGNSIYFSQEQAMQTQ